MIVRCPDCRANYEITRPRELMGRVKVRCPRCKAVFPVAGDGRADAPGGRGSPAGEGGTGGREPDRGDPAVPRRRIVDPALARRLARAMIAEITLGREAECAEARRTRTVLSRFGPAISAAYDLYGGRVSGELPAFRRIFRDAVNEVLGGGARIL